MTPREMTDDALDAEIAMAMATSAKDPFALALAVQGQRIPSPTRDPAARDGVAAWLAKDGSAVSIVFFVRSATARIHRPNGRPVVVNAPTPGRALAEAAVAFLRARGAK